MQTVNFASVASLVSSILVDARSFKDLKDEPRAKAEHASLKRWIGPYAEGLPGGERALAYYSAARWIEARALDEKESEKPSDAYLMVLKEIQVRLARISDLCRGVPHPGVAAWFGLDGVARSWDDGRRPDLDKILAEREFQASLTKTLENELKSLRAAVNANAATADANAILALRVLSRMEGTLSRMESAGLDRADIELITRLLRETAANTSRYGTGRKPQTVVAKPVVS